MAKAVWHWGCSVANDASGAPGETPEYLALPGHAGLCSGRLFASLAARGTSMDAFKIIDETLVGGMEVEDPQGLLASGNPAQALEQDSEGGYVVSGEAAGFHKRNRSGAAKRRARRVRELAPTASEPPLTPLPATGEGLVAKKSRQGSEEPPPSVHRSAKRPRALKTGTFALATDPLARAIVPEGNPDRGDNSGTAHSGQGSGNQRTGGDPGRTAAQFCRNRNAA